MMELEKGERITVYREWLLRPRSCLAPRNIFETGQTGTTGFSSSLVTLKYPV